MKAKTKAPHVWVVEVFNLQGKWIPTLNVEATRGRLVGMIDREVIRFKGFRYRIRKYVRQP